MKVGVTLHERADSAFEQFMVDDLGVYHPVAGNASEANMSTDGETTTR